MLTPMDIQEKQFKTGLGYDKKEVEQFLHDLSIDYDTLLSENNNLKSKIKGLDENLAYYKSIEKTLQKALILAEKTAQDTRATAFREAEAIELEAKNKASQLLTASKHQIELYEHKILNLMQQYDLFKIHFENLLHAQLELLNSKSFSINTDDFSYKEATEQLKNNSEAQPIADAKISSEIAEVAATNIPEDEDKNQITFDFLKESTGPKSYQTEDGFEIFTLKDE